MASVAIDTETEWLEADGLGGFASGTTAGIATRRYHALLLVAADPPVDRRVLVNGFVAWLETPAGRLSLTRHHYAPGVTTDADATIERFEPEPWPTFYYSTRDGLRVRSEILAERGRQNVMVRFTLESPRPELVLCLRPLLSGREFHHLHHQNPGFRFDPERRRSLLRWQPYPSVPAVQSWCNGDYEHAPEWYRSCRYLEEQRRGLDCDEDLAAPGILRFDLSRKPALWLLSASTAGGDELDPQSAEKQAERLLENERARRMGLGSPLERAREAYLVERGQGQTIIAGYPWFSDWGRDTFIALRGLCLATGRLQEARNILLEWSGVVSCGMLPNRFPDRGDPEYNSVDASLWYVLATAELLDHPRSPEVLSAADRHALLHASTEIVRGYARGTRFGIRREADGLLAAGISGSQLTWMDAKVGDRVMTPRVGKPVEIQALWINALAALAARDAEFEEWLGVGQRSFQARFYNPQTDCLYDVVDLDHRPGAVDPSLRPNQILAAGGLPFTPLTSERARSVVDLVERKLWTRLGLRSLSPEHPDYAPRYQGGVLERDTAYHQGTVWPWLLGPFIEAWVKTRGSTEHAKREARQRFLAPIHQHLGEGGLGHVSEIADAEPPHTPRGCPFQAWSLGELLRIELQVLAPDSRR